MCLRRQDQHITDQRHCQESRNQITGRGGSPPKRLSLMKPHVLSQALRHKASRLCCPLIPQSKVTVKDDPPYLPETTRETTDAWLLIRITTDVVGRETRPSRNRAGNLRRSFAWWIERRVLDAEMWADCVCLSHLALRFPTRVYKIIYQPYVVDSSWVIAVITFPSCYMPSLLPLHILTRFSVTYGAINSRTLSALLCSSEAAAMCRIVSLYI